MKKICTMVLIGFVTHGFVMAQQSIDDYYVDFAVPDITAFSILDINTNDVVRPGNVKEFAAGIQNYVDQQGNLKPGLAIELAPYRLFARSRKSIAKWAQNKSLKNLQLSIGTAQGDSTNLLAAWGINWTPVDKTDPVEDPGLQRLFANILAAEDDQNAPAFAAKRQAHSAEVNQFLNTLVSKQKLKPTQKPVMLAYFAGEYGIRLGKYSRDSLLYPSTMMDTLLAKFQDQNINLDSEERNSLSELVIKNARFTFAEYEAEEAFMNNFTAEVKRQKQIFIEENWNRLVIQFKGGGKYNSEDNALNDLSLLNWKVFGGVAGRFPGMKRSNSNFARKSQVVCQVNYSSYSDNASALEWEFATGARLLYGKADKRVSADLLYSQASVKGETTETLEYIRYTLGGEIKLGEGLWLELAVGGQKFLQGDDDARVVPEFGLKYAIQQKSRF